MLVLKFYFMGWNYFAVINSYYELSSSYKPQQFPFAGIEIDGEELASFVEHVDKDNDGIITFEEWRDFLFLYPHEATIENIYRYWEKVYLVDIGEQAVIPEGISKHVHATKYLIAGGVAGAASRTATAPLDRLKVVLQVQSTRACIFPAVKSIWKEGGFLGFFRGNGINVLKVAPESAIKFYTFEMLKNVIGGTEGEKRGDVGTVGRLIAGGLAGAVAQTSIYPMDLVKTRLQTCVCEGGNVPTLWKLSRDIWIQEGPRAFYRGLLPSVLGMIPYAGIDLTMYETMKDVSKKYILRESGMIVYIFQYINTWPTSLSLSVRHSMILGIVKSLYSMQNPVLLCNSVVDQFQELLEPPVFTHCRL